MSDSIPVQTATSSSYDLHFGNDLSEELGHFITKYSPSKAFVMVDAFVLEHHRDHFEKVLGSHFETLHVFEVPRGEQAKSFEIFNRATDFILQNGVERQTPLLLLGEALQVTFQVLWLLLYSGNTFDPHPNYTACDGG